MRRFLTVLTVLLGACLVGLLPVVRLASAAHVTEVLTAVESKKKLPDLRLGVAWDRAQKRAKITREWIQAGSADPTLGGSASCAIDPSGCRAEDVKELRFSETTQQVLLSLRVGLYHDLEFHLGAPIILQNQSNIRFASGVSGNSTIFGSTNADDSAYEPANLNYRYPLTEVPASRERGGFGDMKFGLAWSPVVDHKDEGFPTLTLRADVTAPTGTTREPTDQASLLGGSAGSVGLGSTVFDLSISLSRRTSPDAPCFDPYVVFGAALPVITSRRLRDLGYTAPPSGRFLVGTEFLIEEDTEASRLIAIDLGFGVQYTGAGRTWSELSDYLPNFDQTRVPENHAADVPRDAIGYTDYANPRNYSSNIEGAACGTLESVPCGELNRVDEYLGLKGIFAVHVQPTEYAIIRAGLTFGIDTDHFLTNERVGMDSDPASAIGTQCDGAQCVGRVNARNSEGKDERSKYYDPRYDAPGRRLRIEETTNFTVFVGGTAAF